MAATLKTAAGPIAAAAATPAGSNSTEVPPVEIELEHAIAYTPTQGGLHYHPNGRNYLTTVGSAVVINDFADTHSQYFLRGHDDTISCLAISQLGHRIASGQEGRNSDVCIWDFETRTLLFRLAEHDHGIAAVAFSHDDLLLATAGYAEDRKLIIWDVSTGHIVTSVTQQPCPTTVLVWAGFVRDIKRRDTNRYLLCSAGAHQIVHWSLDARTGDMQADKVSAEGRVTMVRAISCVAFSEDREVMYAGTTTGDFAVVVTKDRKLRRTITACRSGVLSLLVWGDVVLVGGGDGSVSLFDQSLVRQCHVDVQGGVKAMSLSPDRQEVVVGTAMGLVYRVRVEPKAKRMSALVVCENHAGPVRSIQYAKEASDRFASISDDCSVRVWDASDYSVIARVHVRDAGKPLCLVYTLDLLITGWQDGQVRAFEADSGRALWVIPNAHKGGVTAISISHNERFVVTGGHEGEVRLWELRSRELVSHLKGHHLPVTSIAIYSDDMHAVSCSLDRSIICWDLRTEKRVSTHLQRMGGVHRVQLSGDETLVMTVGQEKRLTCWDLREHHPITYRDLSPKGNDESHALALSPDGRMVATGGTGQVLKLWDVEGSIQLAAHAMGHSKTINDLAFSPDGKQVVSGGDDGGIFVWNIYTD